MLGIIPFQSGWLNTLTVSDNINVILHENHDANDDNWPSRATNQLRHKLLTKL